MTGRVPSEPGWGSPIAERAGRGAAVDEYEEQLHAENTFALAADAAAMLLAAFTVGAALFLITGAPVCFPVTMLVGLVVSQWWRRRAEIRRDVRLLRTESDPRRVRRGRTPGLDAAG